MSHKIRIGAPGKSILMGEHSVVYGCPALVAAVSLRLWVELEPSPDAGLHLRVPALDLDHRLDWPEVLDYTRRARRLWKDYSRDPGPESFARLRGRDADHLIKVALGESALFLRQMGGTSRGGGVAGPEHMGGTCLDVRSEIPLGAGFGSSAAAAVGLCKAYLLLHGYRPSLEELEALALEVERRQHGNPSGADAAAVLRGGVIRVTRGEAGPSVRSLEVRSPALAKLRLVNTGRPRESTGEVVAAVAARRAEDPRRFEALLEGMHAATEAFSRALRSAEEVPCQLLEPIRGFEAALEELGAVPEELRRGIRRIERAGGAAKVSGAGALTGPGAGSLLVYHPEPDDFLESGWLEGWEVMDLTLGVPGAVED